MLYLLALFDLDVFGNIFGLSGEKETTEQLSLAIMMYTYILSCLSCTYSFNKNETLTYVGYVILSLSIHISELGILTPKVRPIIGVLATGLVFLGLFKTNSKISISILSLGVFIVGLSTSIDLLLEGAFGYLGEGSYWREIYIKNSTLDLEEIIEPAGYLFILASCIYFTGKENNEMSKMGIKSASLILFFSTIMGVGHTLLVFSNSSVETLASIPLIYSGLLFLLYYLKSNVKSRNIFGKFKSNIMLISCFFFLILPSMPVKSDIISLFIIIPFVVYLSVHLLYVHPYSVFARRV